jgi:hypothetical protein
MIFQNKFGFFKINLDFWKNKILFFFFSYVINILRISSTYHPHIIHISSTYHPHIFCISSTYLPHIHHKSTIVTKTRLSVNSHQILPDPTRKLPQVTILGFYVFKSISRLIIHGRLSHIYLPIPTGSYR